MQRARSIKNLLPCWVSARSMHWRLQFLSAGFVTFWLWSSFTLFRMILRGPGVGGGILTGLIRLNFKIQSRRVPSSETRKRTRVRPPRVRLLSHGRDRRTVMFDRRTVMLRTVMLPAGQKAIQNYGKTRKDDGNQSKTKEKRERGPLGPPGPQSSLFSFVFDWFPLSFLVFP